MTSRSKKKQSRAITSISAVSIPFSYTSADTKVLSSASLAVDDATVSQADIYKSNDKSANGSPSSGRTFKSTTTSEADDNIKVPRVDQLQSKIREAINVLATQQPAPVGVKFYHRKEFEFMAPGDEMANIAASFATPMRVTDAGKSGSDLFWSADRKYLAKTLGDIEVKHAQKMFLSYIAHFANEPDTLLAIYYAMFRVRTSGGRKQYVVVMKNMCLPTDPNKSTPCVYDLKGSLAGRYAKSDNAGAVRGVRKDVNFLLDGRKFFVASVAASERFLGVLSRDIEFLMGCKSIDYSMIYDTDTRGQWYGGIIDILTPYTGRKKLERWVVGAFKGRDIISCAPPRQYGARFAAFIRKATFVLE